MSNSQPQHLLLLDQGVKRAQDVLERSMKNWPKVSSWRSTREIISALPGLDFSDVVQFIPTGASLTVSTLTPTVD